eukprot:Em0020g621a
MHKETKQAVAVKRVDLRQRLYFYSGHDDFQSELIDTKVRDHPNLVGLISYCVDRRARQLYLVEEYCDGGTLASRIQLHQKNNMMFSQEQILEWFRQMVNALVYIHSCRNAHRDLNPRSVLLTAGDEIKLGDIGSQARLSITLEKLNALKEEVPIYLSPEVCRNSGDSKFSYKSDIWSLGCILYELCTLQPLFVAKNLNGYLQQVTSGNFRMHAIPNVYSEVFKTLIERLLSPEPAKRPSPEEILLLPLLQKTTTLAPVALAQDMEVDDCSDGQMRSGSDSPLKTGCEQQSVQKDISDVAHT